MERTGTMRSIGSLDHLFSESTSGPAFDWTILDAIDDAGFSSHSKPFMNFLKNFINAKTFSKGTTKQLRHLILVLQKSIVYFATDHSRMNEKLAEANRNIMAMQHEMENMKRLGAQSFVCPICFATFESMDPLDKHFGSEHPQQLPLWSEICKARDQHSHRRIFDTEIRPGMKTITQSNVMDTVGDMLQQRAQATSVTLQNMQRWVNEKFDEFERIIRAQESLSYTASYESSESEAVKRKRPKRKKKQRTEPQQIPTTEHDPIRVLRPDERSSTTVSRHSTARVNDESSETALFPNASDKTTSRRHTSRHSSESSTSFLDIPKPPSFRSKK